ncbi:hypothetical protein PIB30_064025 [Stylosanthes scabra]|uniref:F-box domain-containing protein n=1 Tax=Stylosanthes scabra TaxID=79078 RepID=A0ABU6SLP8_9FABA|nr:hypothetical protein [Stylosanthes scabra]
MSLPPLQTLQLPDDIVEEILLRLPASSLVPLKLVCCSWRTLISSSKFSNEHLRRSILVDPTLSHHPQIAYCIQSYTHRRIGVFSVRSVLENNRVEPTEVASMIVGQRRSRIIGSCNGLLCLIHESHSLTSAVMSETDYREKRERSRIYTFAPNSSWRSIQDFDFNQLGHSNCPIEDNNQDGVFVSGSNTLNWYLWRDGHGIGNGVADVVISLDLGTESYDILSLPERDPDDNLDLMVELSVLSNCLAVCFEHKKTHWAVWIVKEYGVPQSWTRSVLIPCQQFYRGYFLRPLYISENNALFAIPLLNKLVSCDLNNTDGNLVPVIESPDDTMFTSFHVYHHESLVSPWHYDVANGLCSRIDSFLGLSCPKTEDGAHKLFIFFFFLLIFSLYIFNTNVSKSHIKNLSDSEAQYNRENSINL